MITSPLLFSLSPTELADSIVTPKYDLQTFLTHILNGHMIAITHFFHQALQSCNYPLMMHSLSYPALCDPSSLTNPTPKPTTTDGLVDAAIKTVPIFKALNDWIGPNEALP